MWALLRNNYKMADALDALYDRNKVLRDANMQSQMVDSTSSNESMEREDLEEAIIRDQVQLWLDQHGTKLFALESSKFLSQEKRRKDVANKR